MRRTTIALIVYVIIVVVLVTIVMLGFEKAHAKSIVFRLDDVQDFYKSNQTKAILHLFEQKHVPITVGIIADAIGKDKKVVDTVRQCLTLTNICELALHGFHHEDMRNMTDLAQVQNISHGNNILKQVFDKRADIFIPPYNHYNNGTIHALQTLGFKVLSAGIAGEQEHNKGVDIYNATEPCGLHDYGRTCLSVLGLPNHVSADSDFVLYANHTSLARTNTQILASIADNIKHYDYSVLVIHPQDFKNNITQLGSLLDSLVKQYNPIAMSKLTVPHRTFDVITTKTEKPIILTLDDDWKGQFTNAIPILKKYGYNATFFVSCLGPSAQAPKFVRGQSNEITSWQDLQQIKADKFDIESHGMTHHSLVNQPQSILQREIVDSKKCISDHLGVKPTIFAPAYAKPENNVTIDKLIAENYRFARNGYGNAEFKSGQFDLPVISVNQYDKEQNHNTAQVIEQFAKEVTDTQLPILVWHNIAELQNTETNWYNSTTTPQTFAAELQWLHDNGYSVHPIADLQYKGGKFSLK